MSVEAELAAKIAALEAKVAALEAQGRARPREALAQLGREPPFPPSTYAAIDRMCVPREITDGMAKDVPTGMVQEIVRTTRPIR